MWGARWGRSSFHLEREQMWAHMQHVHKPDEAIHCWEEWVMERHRIQLLWAKESHKSEKLSANSQLDQKVNLLEVYRIVHRNEENIEIFNFNLKGREPDQLHETTRQKLIGSVFKMQPSGWINPSNFFVFLSVYSCKNKSWHISENSTKEKQEV